MSRVFLKNVSAGVPSDALEVCIIGAGFSGMYQLYALRKANITNVRVVEAGSDVGGTWYWNRYPGCRCDVPSVEYSYSFDEELQQDWTWTEMMASQPEIEKYAQHVAQRFKLRDGIDFNTRVLKVVYNENENLWYVHTDQQSKPIYKAKYVITCVGCLSQPNLPDIYHQAVANFKGTTIHTGRWPKTQPDFTGKKICVIGTGSSGIQTLPEVANGKMGKCEVTVMQRTPQYTLPANNHPLSEEYIRKTKENYARIRHFERNSAAGISLVDYLGGSIYNPDVQLPLPDITANILDMSEEERLAMLDKYGFEIVRMFADVRVSEEANDVVCRLFAKQVKRVVKDPVVAEALTPKNYPLGCKRQVIDTNFFEAFNLPNVKLVDLSKGKITQITCDGIDTEQGHYDFDVIIFAVGFDAMTGPITRLNIQGKNGRTVAENWREEGPKTYLGLQMVGFPNLFTVTGPGSPSVLSNMMVSIEQHVDWITQAIVDTRSKQTIEPTAEAQDRWVKHVNNVTKGSMLVKPSCNSWYLGANIPGKPRIFMPYLGGVGAYRKICDNVRAEGYSGFQIK